MNIYVLDHILSCVFRQIKKGQSCKIIQVHDWKLLGSTGTETISTEVTIRETINLVKMLVSSVQDVEDIQFLVEGTRCLAV